MAERVRLPQISSRAFEHPADRAALTALRKVPGFDTALKKLIGLIGEKSLHVIYLASAVRVNEKQFPDLYRVYRECLDVLDFEEQPELFISQTPFVNAGAIGTDKPFIVLNSGALEVLEEPELRFILGHELGHIMADHVLYKTMLKLLLRMTVLRFGVPWGWLVLTAIIAALIEWDRKSELTSDRAGMLCLQSPDDAYGVFMKLAGGRRVEQMSLDEFIAQAEEYESGGDKLDSFYKFLNLLGRSHPFPVLRVAELRRWVEAGDYDAILEGEYARRTGDEKASVYKEFAASARSYRESYRESADPLVQFFRDFGKDAKTGSKKLVGHIREWFAHPDEEDGRDDGA
ncbi:MAG: M48 family metallopeptidase [Deltaproteobacteria bacterium]|nr:M48 family metallopeptidase [Deltaproteobacteria bacterium]